MKDKIGKILLNWRIKTVLPYVKGNLLDIGCGTNQLARSYSGKSTGTDVYQWGDVDVVVENSANLPFEDKTFGTVSIIAALNHIPNRLEVLKEAHRVLQNDGKLIITMIPPKISKMWHMIRKSWDVDQRERGMKQGEVFGLTSRELSRLLSEAEFHIIYKKKFMFGINNLTISKKRND